MHMGGLCAAIMIIPACLVTLRYEQLKDHGGLF